MSSCPVFVGGRGVGPAVTGPVLVTRDGFSPRYDLDRATGVISRAEHDLEGYEIAGTILVIDRAKGGVAAGWALPELATRQLAPLALVFEQTNPVFVQGCVAAGIAVAEGLSPRPTDYLRTGQICRLDPAAGVLELATTDDGSATHGLSEMREPASTPHQHS